MIPLRYLASFLLACVVVLTMLLTGLRLFGGFDKPQHQRHLHSVELLSGYERVDLAEALGEGRGRAAPAGPRIEDIEALELPPREISGFVQLEVTVAPDGSVLDAEVVGTAPPGLYEQQALDAVRQRRYAPVATPEGRTISEVVDFRIERDSQPEVEATEGR